MEMPSTSVASLEAAPSLSTIMAMAWNHNVSALTLRPPSFLNISMEEFELVNSHVWYGLICLYSLTTVCALGGNLMAASVLYFGKRSARDIRLFLLNLALSDILMSLFSIPFTFTSFVLGRWIWPNWLCPVVHGMQHVSVFVSIYTLTVIGIDRYVNIKFPFHTNCWQSPYPQLMMLATWFLGGGLGMFMWFHSSTEILVETMDATYYSCNENWPTVEDEKIFTAGIFLLVFAIPLGILGTVYGSIAFTLYSHAAPGNPDTMRDNAQRCAKMKSIKMLCLIVGIFAICWTPTHLFQMIRVFWGDTFDHLRGGDSANFRYVTIVIVVHWISQANSMTNPIVYCYLSENFRADLRSIIQRCSKCCRQRRNFPVTATSVVLDPLNSVLINCDGNGNDTGTLNGYLKQEIPEGRRDSGEYFAMGPLNGRLHQQPQLQPNECFQKESGRHNGTNGKGVKFKCSFSKSGGTSSGSGGSVESRCINLPPKRVIPAYQVQRKQHDGSGSSAGKTAFERDKWSRKSSTSRTTSSSSGILMLNGPSCNGGNLASFKMETVHKVGLM